MSERKVEPTAAAADQTADEFDDLLQRAEEGDETIRPKVQALLTNPAVADLLGNLARRVQVAIVDGISGGNVAVQEGVKKKVDDMRAELAGPDAGPLERQLVERIITCWLAVHVAELKASVYTTLAPDKADYWDRRIDSAHKRHLSAVKALATIRKLALPAIQVNIARRQTNVVGTAGE